MLSQLPPNVPVLGTTATANNRVIEDIQEQLGEIAIQRGSLVRSSLSLQTLRMEDQAQRLAWLAARITDLPGTGIVYVLTRRDAEQVAAWLSCQGIAAYAYYSNVAHDDFPDSNAYRQHLEDLLLDNRVKVLVATTALGMGYDKPDLGFVVHYQTPGSVVSYYQQVGRAGRAIDSARVVLLFGREDEAIHEHFRSTAFPPEDDVSSILDALEATDGLSVPELQRHLNLTPGQIDKVLKILSVENPAPILKSGSKWQRTPVPFALDRDRIERLTTQREFEWQQMQEYIEADTCLMAYLQRVLDDPEVSDCGRCANCLGEPVVEPGIEHATVIEATRFLRNSEFPFKPRIRVPSSALPEYGLQGNLPPRLRATEGRILSRWGDAGWGSLVVQDKQAGHFREELVDAMTEMIETRWLPEPAPEWVTCVPSLHRPTLVPTFAASLAQRLGLPFRDVILKVRDNEPQKDQQNGFHQCRNLDGAFQIAEDLKMAPVLLVDDVIDSGWTVTVLAALLRSSGSGVVYPTALASTSRGQ